MKIQHLNCGTLRPADAAFGGTEFVCHCLLLDLGGRFVLVDTGIGLRDIADPAGRLEQWFVERMQPALIASETAIAQVTRMHGDPQQVSDIILTHLDRDHVGGLADFPWAQVHTSPDARSTMFGRRVGRDRDRILDTQWAHEVRWADIPFPLDDWNGFRSWGLPGLEGTGIMLIDLPGHSKGHAGVAVPTSQGWLLHAGDAYFHDSQLSNPHEVPEPIMAFAAATEENRHDRERTERALATLSRRGVTVVPSHDPAPFHRHSR